VKFERLRQKIHMKMEMVFISYLWRWWRWVLFMETLVMWPLFQTT